jgi:hypothetical protein
VFPVRYELDFTFYSDELQDRNGQVVVFAAG